MKIAMFYQSLISDWNHGNAHFLRGIAGQLQRQGHIVEVFEPQDSWPLANLFQQHGAEPILNFHEKYPDLKSFRYSPKELDLDFIFEDTDLVIVHEWNDHQLVKQIGRHRRSNSGYKLLFHDTHHRVITEPGYMEKFELENFDGVLAFGQVLRDIYKSRGLSTNVWTWHEAADTAVFYPIENHTKEDVVWIGNWGDEERTEEITQFLINPVSDLNLTGSVHGVRYPDSAKLHLQQAGLEYSGWLANYKVPEVFSNFRFTVHIPRKPYTQILPGIPTIRPFEAMACRIPLICSPWQDQENLFRPGRDYLIAENSSQMKKHMRTIINEPDFADHIAASGYETITQRHTCKHRVKELMEICGQLGIDTDAAPRNNNKSKMEIS